MDLSRTSKSKTRSKSKSEKKHKKHKSKSKKKAKKIENTKKTSQVATTVVSEGYDDNDISTLLPPEPTMEDAFNNKDNLKILKEARKRAISDGAKIQDSEWETLKDKNGITVSKAQSENDQVILKKEMTVNASIEDIAENIQNLDERKRMNSKIEKIEEIDEVGNNSRIFYQKMSGNIIFKSRDFSV